MDLIVLLIQFAIIGLFFFRFSIIPYIPKSIREFYLRVFKDIKFNLGVWWKTIIIPIMVGFILFLGWVIYHQIVFGTPATYPISENIYAYIISSGILAPISEEIFQCFLLSFAFIFFSCIYKNKLILFLMNFFSLIIVSFIIALYHANPATINFYLRFFHFIVYGAIYYIYNRNLVPAIVIHSSWNLFLLYLYFIN